MKRRCSMLLVVVALVALTMTARSQDQGAGGDSSSFDFWLGTWDLSWMGRDSNQANGENTVTRILGGRVLQEHFKALSGPMSGYEGMSVSVYDSSVGKWFQTWVDADGNYLDFTGGLIGADRYFSREYHDTSGALVQQRMVFYNITADAFDWDWERSYDGGKTWELRWEIHYKRRK